MHLPDIDRLCADAVAQAAAGLAEDEPSCPESMRTFEALIEAVRSWPARFHCSTSRECVAVFEAPSAEDARAWIIEHLAGHDEPYGIGVFTDGIGCCRGDQADD